MPSGHNDKNANQESVEEAVLKYVGVGLDHQNHDPQLHTKDLENKHSKKQNIVESSSDVDVNNNDDSNRNEDNNDDSENISALNANESSSNVDHANSNEQHNAVMDWYLRQTAHSQQDDEDDENNNNTDNGNDSNNHFSQSDIVVDDDDDKNKKDAGVGVDDDHQSMAMAAVAAAYTLSKNNNNNNSIANDSNSRKRQHDNGNNHENSQKKRKNNNDDDDRQIGNVDPELTTLGDADDNDTNNDVIDRDQLVHKAIIDADSITQHPDFQQYLNTAADTDDNEKLKHIKDHLMRTHGLNHQNKNHNDDTDDLSNSTKQYSELQKDSMLESSLNKSRNYMEVLPKVISQDTQPHQQKSPSHDNEAGSVDNSEISQLLQSAATKASSLVSLSSSSATPSTSRSNNSKAFDKAEDAALERFINEYEAIERLTRQQVCERIWSSDRPKDNFWNNIYKVLPYRSSSSIYKHMRRKYHIFEQRGKWTAEEEQELAKLCAEKEGQWAEIGKTLGRMPEDCRDRWRNYVKCGTNRASNRWSVEEEELLKKVISDMLEEAQQQQSQLHPNLLEEEQHLLQDDQNDHRNNDEDDDDTASAAAAAAAAAIQEQQQLLQQKQQDDDDAIAAAAAAASSSLGDNKDEDKPHDSLGIQLDDNSQNSMVPAPSATSTHSKSLSNTIRRHNNKLRKSLMGNGKLDFKDIINWTIVSERMGGTRSRIQCRYKWNKLVKREAIAKIQTVKDDDMLWIFEKLRDLGITEDSQVDWDELAALKPGMKLNGLELKLCYERMKKKVKGYKQKSINEISKELVDYFSSNISMKTEN
ncbi:BAH_G0002410.mRNA.1.CDS.1 [Saccharomyces cerevisiae]|nr:BAH_G0002410.mRNA.1.CDS.1 [Saccharomyces cerevisiae]CAI7042337.1 BAH_G0002410.mRNA.1.CDS.1 [Saccharomyces cerevisiae]